MMQPVSCQPIVQIVSSSTDCSESPLQPLPDANNNNASCANKQLIKPSADIVFSNQTSKLLKQVASCSSSAPVMGKYNLRKKSVQTRSEVVKKQQEAKLHLRGLDDSKESKPKKRNSQLSRYKRKNANARERNRVQAINAAFERLKRNLPVSIQEKSAPASSPSSKADLTKIATLRTAIDYINLLLCKLRDQEDGLSPVNEPVAEDQVHSTSELSCDKPPKEDDLRMDALPDISFISSDELSILSYTSDEENQLSKCNNQTFDLMPACVNDGSAQNETFTIKSSDSSSFADKTFTIKSSDSSSFADKTYVNPSAVADQYNSRVNSHLTNSQLTNGQLTNVQLTNGQVINSRQFNQTTIVNNQTYPVSSPALSNLNIIHNQQSNSQYAGSERFYTYTQSPQLDLDRTKLAGDLLDSNNNQFFNQVSRFRNLVASTPLLDKSNDHHVPVAINHNHQLQCTLFSPIKGDDQQAANHLSFKSSLLNEDSPFNCLEDIENSDGNYLYTPTLTSNDDFDLIL